MDTTIRNLDPDLYRRLKAHAALHGRTIGDVVNEAMRELLDREGGVETAQAGETPSTSRREPGTEREPAGSALADAVTAREELRERRVRKAWQASRAEPTVRDDARDWLARHPSPDPEIDEMWQQALEGRGPLFDWLEGDANALEGIEHPVRALLASHPFVRYLRCSNRTTSAA